ncbi:hypothetical protein BAX94_11370 [Elizabethkingia meningoseptica]|uniref:helix-turn-helix transcriptional regulator n=1 Tax=Elizabethkingia meningoseptica TaxID=238 RepID=UPI0008A8409D|nr:helix-turn-helix domain-containing protein [Elizabethkingia meningoseptica]MDE5448563.1 helix-turn-helix domain-containing protein [Elizabethkingia meningoseptica]MDE5472525.1 helix-turn-helix domain-containing protein [Elizabethkingia meningoseptica]MDE5520443.1 helix-turn-helix domain-containing protein [Elizabethkingia meningoseptica]MDE5523841.1 helix-turn-helix domain-containing protein [Elizabethkingia meningoseptica]OHT28547.1 hypothetical protein BGC12_12835 [Elizabethkingia meningo
MFNNNNQQLSEELVATAKENEFLTIDQAATFLGYKASTLYKKNCLGEIPYYNPSGGKVFYSRRELEDWIKNKTQKSNHSTEQFINYLNLKTA